SGSREVLERYVVDRVIRELEEPELARVAHPADARLVTVARRKAAFLAHRALVRERIELAPDTPAHEARRDDHGRIARMQAPEERILHVMVAGELEVVDQLVTPRPLILTRDGPHPIHLALADRKRAVHLARHGISRAERGEDEQRDDRRQRPHSHTG